jgi:hypothetical protein
MDTQLGSATPQPAPTSYTEVATTMTNGFLSQVKATCLAENAAILVCAIDDVIMDHCSGTVTCTNDAALKSVQCNPAQVVAAAVAAAQAAAPPGDVVTTMTTLTRGFPVPSGAEGTGDAAIATASYLALRCAAKNFAQQAVTFPLLDLRDCSRVTITGMNQLDEEVRCAMNAISELVPADTLGAPPPKPIWDNPVTMTLLAGGAFLLIVLGASIGGVLHASDVAKGK